MRLLVVSHPAAAAVNQRPYAALARLGWEVHLVMPDRWRDDFDGTPFSTTLVEDLRADGRRVPVLLAGRPQRHLYRARLTPIVRAVAPDVAFLEAEPFAAPAWQWARALAAGGVPFGVQHAETLRRPLPPPARAFRRHVLRRAAFVAARSPRAAALIDGLPVAFVPHPLPDWPLPDGPPAPGRPFTVGFAGRLVAEKGVRDLLAAFAALGDARLVVVGDGPLRPEVDAAAGGDSRITLRADVRHDAMADVYRGLDVLAVPSRSTPDWTEQFGRVIVEALSLGVPVVGSDSGEIPWLLELTGGGLVVPEGDVAALAGALERLRADPALRARLGATGRERSLARFSLRASTTQLDALLRGALR